MRDLYIGLKFLSVFLLSRLSFRLDFIIEIVASSFIAVSGLIFLLVLFYSGKVSALGDWSSDQVLFIYGFSLLPTTIFQLVAPNLYRFGEKYVIEGNFDRVLLRPLNSVVQILTETFSIESLVSLPIGVSLMLITGAKIGIDWSVIDIAWLIVSALAGAVILISFFMMLSSFSFHFEDRFGIVPPFYNMMTFGRYPLPIYDKLIQVILTWMVPYGFVSFYPATHFFSEKYFTWLCYLSPIVAVVMIIITSFFWKLGIDKYGSTGS